MNFWTSVRLVAEREVTSKLRSKAFLIMSGVLLAIIAATTVVPNLIGGDDPVKVAGIGTAPEGVDLSQMDDPDGTAYFDVVESDVSLDEAKQLLRDGDVEAAVKFDPNGRTIVWGLDETPTRAVEALSLAPKVELVDPGTRDEQTVYFVAIAFAILFFTSAMTFGGQIAQSVVEEKQTRIVEILLSAMNARTLLTGKVLGNAVLAIGQMIAVVAVALLGLSLTGQRIGIPDLGPAIGWFVPFYVLGFFMLASMFAAAAALVSRSEDIPSVTTPITMLVMIPYMLVFIVNGDETWMRVLSWVPFSAPIAMPTQIYTQEAMWWEPIGSLIVLALATLVILRLAERTYTNSLLRTGTRVPLKEALSLSR